MAEHDLIAAIRNGVPPGVELDEREEALLNLAQRQLLDTYLDAQREVAEQQARAAGGVLTGARLALDD